MEFKRRFSCLWQVLPGGPVGGTDIRGGPMIPVSSLPSGQGGACMGRKHPLFPEPYQCSTRGPALPYHARTGIVGRRFTCLRCPCTYASKSGLTEHIRHVHEKAIGARLAGKASPFARTITII